MALVSLVSHNWHLLEETARGLEAALVYSNGQGIEIDLAVNLSHASLLSPVNSQQVLHKCVLVFLSCSPAALLLPKRKEERLLL